MTLADTRRRPTRTTARLLLAAALVGCRDDVGDVESIAGTYRLTAVPDPASEARQPGYESSVTGLVTLEVARAARRGAGAGEAPPPITGRGAIRTCSARGACSTRQVRVSARWAEDDIFGPGTAAGALRLLVDQSESGGPAPPAWVVADVRPRRGSLRGTYVVIFSTGARDSPDVSGAIRLTRMW